MKATMLASLVVTLLYHETPRSFADQTPDSLSTSGSFESLTKTTDYTIDVGHSIFVEPGIRVSHTLDLVTFSTHDSANIEFQTADGRTIYPSPVSIRRDQAEGWKWNRGNFELYHSLTARRAAQDDTDSNLKSMQDSAKKLKSKTNTTQDDKQGLGKKLRVRWLYGENPFPTAELFNSAAIQQLTHVSPIGF